MTEPAMLEASRVGAHASRYLAAPQRSGRVVSTFRHGFNILFNEGSDPGFVSIQTSDVPLHPWGVQVSGLAALPPVGTAASNQAGDIRLVNELSIDLGGAEVCRLRIAPFSAEEAALAHGRARLLHQFVGELVDPFQEQIRAILERWHEPGDANVLLDLVGLGSGSTPAGDDVFTGIIAGLTAVDSVTIDAKAVLSGPRSAPREARSPLPSAQMITAALDGSFPELLRDLVASLGEQEISEPEIGGLARKVAGLGASSGQMMLRGVLAALR